LREGSERNPSLVSLHGAAKASRELDSCGFKLVKVELSPESKPDDVLGKLLSEGVRMKTNVLAGGRQSSFESCGGCGKIFRGKTRAPRVDLSRHTHGFLRTNCIGWGSLAG
jgi:hypothetical protein